MLTFQLEQYLLEHSGAVLVEKLKYLQLSPAF